MVFVIIIYIEGRGSGRTSKAVIMYDGGGEWLVM